MLLVDTNVWLAAADRRARDHRRCRQVLEDHRGELASTVPVAERLDLTAVATLGHRGFRSGRPAHRDTFTLLPDED